MPYVPGLQTDVFISYAHNDDPAWIGGFESMLEMRLRERLGAAVEIWKDTRKIRFGQNWQTEIELGIAGAAAFVAVLSPSYRTSAWCARERKRFSAQFASLDEMKTGGRYRLLKVVKTAWENNEHREFLPQLEDILFFRAGVEGGDEEFLPGSMEFDRKVRECASGIASLLITMRRQRERVFVASPADDCYAESEELKSELRELRYDVRPDGTLDSSYSDTLIKREMEEALLTVHLLGGAYDPFVEHQIRLAAAAAKRMLFWLSRDALETAVEDQRKLVDSVRRGEDLPANFDLLEASSARGMIEHALEILKPLRPAAAAPARRNGAAQVYLICDPTAAEDAAFAADLQARIQTKEGMEVQVPQAELATPAAAMERHRQLLRGCDGVLLYRGSAPPQWFLQTAPDVLLAELQLSRPPIRSKAFLLSDPAILPGLPNVIARSPGFQLADLEPFLAPLRHQEIALGGR
jgi:hypothetical protein